MCSFSSIVKVGGVALDQLLAILLGVQPFIYMLKELERKLVLNW